MAMDDINVPKTFSERARETPTGVSKQTYVYEGAEVIKTGRVASKSLASGKKDTVVEITPVHSTVGTWKKWVAEAHLYEIEG